MNVDGPDLEDRYRRVLRLLPGYYRATWEDDMVAAYLDSRMTGDEDEDEYIVEFGRPAWPEVASVAGLAARLYLGGAGAPRRYFAWGQAVRRAVLAVMLAHAVQGLAALVSVASHHRLGGFPIPPPSIATAPPGGVWLVVLSLANYANYAWIVVFAALVLGYYRTAWVIAVPATVLGLAGPLQAQLAGTMLLPFGWSAYWVLLVLAPVLAMAAFHRDAPPAASRSWLLALPVGYLVVAVPLLAVQAVDNAAWLPDFSGQCCLLVALACVAHAPRAWSRRAAASGVWSLTLTLLAAVAGVFRIVSAGDYLHDPHLIHVSLAELLILAVAVALVAPNAARAQEAAPVPPRYPYPGWPA
jgi:hypothetical protein